MIVLPSFNMKTRLQHLTVLKHIFGSKRYLLCSIAIVFFTAGLILYIGNLIKSRQQSKSLSIRRIDVSFMSMADHDVHQTGLTEIVSEDTHKTIQEKEQKFIMDHIRRNQKYFHNYTDCLKKRFANFGQTLPTRLMKFPLSFNELVGNFNKECSIEVLGINAKCQTKTVGRIYIQRKPMEMTALKQELPDVRLGGLWNPTECIPKAKVAIVIPFRKREQHLPVLLRYLHPLLQRQNLLYRIFVIEQIDDYPFNRAKLMNVGFKEASKVFDFNCFVFHDVDLIPEDDRNDYGCPSSPRHMSVAIDKFDYNLPYAGLFGGVEMFTKEHFKQINGFRNSYWGWGAEDDDLYRRVVKVGLQLSRPPVSFGRYIMIKHASSEKPPDRMDKLRVAEDALDTDGLLSLHYKVLSFYENLLYTLIKVDLRMEDDMEY